MCNVYIFFVYAGRYCYVHFKIHLENIKCNRHQRWIRSSSTFWILLISITDYLSSHVIMFHRCSHMGSDSYHNSEICVELDNLFQLFKSTSFVSINANRILPTQATSREQSLCEFQVDSAWSAGSTNNKSSVPMDLQMAALSLWPHNVQCYQDVSRF